MNLIIDYLKDVRWISAFLLFLLISPVYSQSPDRGVNASNGAGPSSSSNRVPVPPPNPNSQPNPSNPPNPASDPGPLKITVGTPRLNNDASSEIYPNPDSGLILENGDFSLPDIDPNDSSQPNAKYHFSIFSNAQGWTAISGEFIELQNHSDGSDQDQQWCELDSDWPAGARREGAPSHGIKQSKAINKGSYLLVFDYKGRNANNVSNQPVTAASFTVKADPDNADEKTLVEVTGASISEWKRAFVPFTIDGGDVGVTQEQVNFTFDIPAGTGDSVGPLIDNVILFPADVIQVDAFIPQEWLGVPLSSTRIDEGNRRKQPMDASLTSGSAVFVRDVLPDFVKIKQTVTVCTFRDADPDGSTESASNACVVGRTREYNRSILVDGHIPPGSEPTDQATATATHGSTVTHPSKDKISVNIHMSAPNPLVFGSSAGPIRYEVIVEIDRSNPSNPNYRISGTRAKFPAYEIYINHQRVHEYSPIPGGYSPLSLMMSGDNVQENGNLD